MKLTLDLLPPSVRLTRFLLGNIPWNKGKRGYSIIKKTAWTPEEIEILKQGYKKEFLDLPSLCSQLKRKPSAVCDYAGKYGLTKRAGRKRRYFDDAFLIENYQQYSNRELAEKIGETRFIIAGRLGQLGLKRDKEFFRKQISKRQKGAWANPKSKFNSRGFRQFLSDRMTSMQERGKLNKGNAQYKSGHRTDLGIYVRSGWEANYARYLNWLLARGEIKEWHYEKVRFDFPVKRGTRSYTPDFQVIENDGSIVYHEVKGWMTQKGKTRLNRMRIHHPDVKIILIAQKEYSALAKWRGLIKGWE